MSELISSISSRLNLLTETRFLVIMPTKNIMPDYSSESIMFNFTDFVIGPVELASANADYAGYSIEVPSPFVRSSNKTETFNYIMDSNLTQYIFLSNWIDKIVSAETGTGSISTVTMNDYMLPIRVLILSEFKTPVLEITYNDAWVQMLGPVNFSYQGNANVVKSSFSIKYSLRSFSTDVSKYIQ